MNNKDSSPTAPNFASKRNFQGTSFNLKYIKPDYLNETEENEISIPSISPLRHGSSIAQSINEGHGLLKCASSSSSYQAGESHKVEDLHRESYKDLLGFEASQQGSHRSNLYIQAPFSITEESGGGQSPPKNTMPNRAGTRISARRDQYITFEGSQKKTKSDTDISTFKTGTGDITLDPQANSNQLNTEKTIMEPSSDIEAQNIALNMPNTPIDSPTENQNLVIPQVAPAPSPGQMTPEETRLFNMAVPEARIYVNKAIAGFAVAILTSICVLLPLSGVGYFETLLIGPFAYCIVWTVIEIYYTMKLVDFLYFDSGDFFKVFDMSNVIITLLVLQFRIANIISTSAYVSLLYFLAAHSYLYQSKGFIMKRLPMIITRYLYGFQVIFFLLRLDGYSDWEWKYVFSLTWVLLAAKICGNLWRIVTVLYAILTKPYPRRITKILGFTWYFAAHSLVPIPLFAVYGFVVYWSPARDFSVITNTAIVCIVVSAVLLVYTLLVRKYILAFILRLKLIKSLLVEYDREQERLKVKKEIALEVEMKEQYFVMLSSTYFLPLHKSFYAKGKESVDKIKSVFSKLRPNRKTNNKDNENRVETVGDVPRLRKDKLNLDIRLARLGDPKVRFSDRKGTDRLRTRDVGDIESSPVAQKGKMAMSMDELDKVQDWDALSIKPKPVNEEEEVCYLCYVNPRDVILMNCGHGGICYDCASTMVKQKNECMECRKEVDSIIKIDPNPKAFNIVKGTESHKVVVKIIENNENK